MEALRSVLGAEVAKEAILAILRCFRSSISPGSVQKISTRKFEEDFWSGAKAQGMVVQSGCSRKHRVPLFKALAASIWFMCQLLNARRNRSLNLQLLAVLIRIDEAPRAIGGATAHVLQSDDLLHRHAVSRQSFGSKSQTTEC